MLDIASALSVAWVSAVEICFAPPGSSATGVNGGLCLSSRLSGEASFCLARGCG